MQYLVLIIGLLLVGFSLYQAVSLGKEIYKKIKVRKEKKNHINNEQ